MFYSFAHAERTSLLLLYSSFLLRLQTLVSKPRFDTHLTPLFLPPICKLFLIKKRLFLLDRLCGTTRKKASWNVLCRMQQLVNLSIFLNYLVFFIFMSCTAFFVEGFFFSFFFWSRCTSNQMPNKLYHEGQSCLCSFCFRSLGLRSHNVLFDSFERLKSRMTPLNVLMPSQRFPCPSWKSITLKCHVSQRGGSPM